jgi:bifunctional non-homologous end joining protein LigD
MQPRCELKWHTILRFIINTGMALKQSLQKQKQTARTAGIVKENSREKSPSIIERPHSVRSAGKEKLSKFITPMLAQIHDKPFNNEDWIFEIKWDGYRAVAEVDHGNVKLYSRNGLSFSRLYPRVAQALAGLPEDAILDGEIVVLNQNQKPDFQKLQQYDIHPSLPIVYYVFDCIAYHGKSITHLPLVERKKIAHQIIPAENNVIKYSDHVRGDGVEFFKQVTNLDLEGMIAKKADSTYLPGKRTGNWLKIKNHNTQEAIIAGYTAPRGGRMYFGALVLAIREGKSLRYIGHTGTGFTNELLKQIYQKLEPLKRATSPFSEKIPVNAGVTWVEPELVCAIKFTEITADGILRHPVFMGLRMDKSARETTKLDIESGASKKTNAKKNIKSSSGKQEHKETIEADGKTIVITNQQKLYWPEEKITKGDVLNYYNAVKRYILPYLKDRPQSLRRNPNGISDEGFFQKDAGASVPSWVKTVNLPAESANRTVDYIICNDAATLFYLNNLGCIEINAWNSRIGKLDYPDYMILDLDPSEKNSFDQIIETALVIKEILDKAGATAYCKTSGASGLHIYVPLHAQYTYEQIRAFAELIVRLTEEQLPTTTTVERSLNKRKGRIYLDYLQNKKGQTLASVYSVRPKPGATVSTPLDWKEVKPGLKPSQFTIFNLMERLQKTGDLFSGVLRDKINLLKCIKNLEHVKK